LGFDAYKARGALRITLGRFNTMEEADRFLAALPKALATLRPIRSSAATPLTAAIS
jgi:cysteine desulfurase